MKKSIYPRLAWSGIVKNRKLYFPYILSCMGMVMMFYIIHFLSYSPLLHEMKKGGSSLEMILSLGKFVIAVFALLFLFYTNSFLIRRRYKEFGLFNILGMDKHSISRIILWESLIVSAFGLIGGMGLGIVFSKLAELGLLNAIHGAIDYRFAIPAEAITYTLIIFGIIFLLLTVKSLWQVRRCKPLELLRSENFGEKPPKANWVFAVLGVIILGVAYYLAVSIKTPLTALTLFFVAVIMVIIATYLLFMSGSVALCKILQKNRKYYYQKQHFVSVSSMVYRMKRNGAGLASICILCTMVLVMISSSASLYFGINDALRARFPRDIDISVNMEGLDNLSDEKLENIRHTYEKVFASHQFTPENVQEYRYAAIAGLVSGDAVQADHNAVLDSFGINYDDIRMLYFVSVDDYNRVMGTDYTLSSGEALLHTLRCTYSRDSLSMNGCELHIAGTVDEFIRIGEANTMVIPSLMLVIPDYDTLRPLESLVDTYGNRMLSTKYYYGYDYDEALSDEEAIRIYNDQTNALGDTFIADQDGYSYSGGCMAAEKEDFFATFGGLFFLGIVLSIVFIFAAAMIIYYKQISEGYEDQSRFAIMQKVGMTKTDIKKSINSQVLTVFFAPLIFAGLHLGFAFPLVWKMLQLFNLHNLPLVIWITVGAFVVFGIFYALIYKATARAYYSIVADGGNA